MKLLVHLIVGLFVVVAQTTLMQALCPGSYCYDLLIPFVIHLGRSFSMTWGFPMAVGFGLLNDSLSGGTFGLYTTTYFWTLVLIYWLLTFLHARSSLIWPIIVSLGVLLENGLVLVILSLAGRSPDVMAAIISVVLPQFVLALVSGPFMLRFFHWLTTSLTMLSRSRFAKDET